MSIVVLVLMLFVYGGFHVHFLMTYGKYRLLEITENITGMA